MILAWGGSRGEVQAARAGGAFLAAPRRASSLVDAAVHGVAVSRNAGVKGSVPLGGSHALAMARAVRSKLRARERPAAAVIGASVQGSS